VARQEPFEVLGLGGREGGIEDLQPAGRGPRRLGSFAQGEGREGAEGPAVPGEELLLDLAAFEERGEQAEAVRFHGLERAAGEQQALGDETPETLAAHRRQDRREDPELDFRAAEARPFLGENEMAAQHHLEAAAEAVAFDQGRHRHRVARELADEAVEGGEHRRRSVLAVLFHRGAEREVAAGAAQDHQAQLADPEVRVEGRAELAGHLHAEDVALGLVQHEPEDGAVLDEVGADRRVGAHRWAPTGR